MRALHRSGLIVFSLVFLSSQTHAQETIVHGKVIDANSGDAVPFVNIVFKGTSIGTTTDFDGNYHIQSTHPTDSLQASYIGYVIKSKVVSKGIRQTINFQLLEETTNLQAVEVYAGENPS